MLEDVALEDEALENLALEDLALGVWSARDSIERRRAARSDVRVKHRGCNKGRFEWRGITRR